MTGPPGTAGSGGPAGATSEPYDRFTGHSLDRLTALSDGLFAMAMTLLVLDVRVPVSEAGAADLPAG